MVSEDQQLNFDFHIYVHTHIHKTNKLCLWDPVPFQQETMNGFPGAEGEEQPGKTLSFPSVCCTRQALVAVPYWWAGCSMRCEKGTISPVRDWPWLSVAGMGFSSHINEKTPLAFYASQNNNNKNNEWILTCWAWDMSKRLSFLEQSDE